MRWPSTFHGAMACALLTFIFRPTPRRPRAHVPDIYPDIATLDDPPDDAQKPAGRPRPAPTPKPKLKAKPVRARHASDPDPFASVPATPTTTSQPSRPPTSASGSTSATSVHDSPKPKSRGLPQFISNSFRTWFAGGPKNGDVRTGDDESLEKQDWPPRRVRGEGSSSIAGSKKAPTEKAGDEMEIEFEQQNAPSASPRVRRPPQQINAVASSSRVQLPAPSPHRSPVDSEMPVQHARTPPSRSPPRRSPHHSPPRSPDRHSTQGGRSPSPIDWGSPMEEQSKAMSPAQAYAMLKRSSASPSKMQPPPRRGSPLPNDTSHNDRHSPSRHNAGSSTRDNSLSRRDVESVHRGNVSGVLPRLSFTGGGSSSGGSLRNRHRSIGSTSGERGSLTRRSRAPSPHRDVHRSQYHLPSPPRATSSRLPPRTGTPLARKAKHNTQDHEALQLEFKPIVHRQHPSDDREPRRHSFPAALPRIDFESIRGSPAPAAAPRQSLPPRPPPHRPPPARRHSLFSPRAPPSTSVSPVQYSASTSDRLLIEQLGLQTLMAMARNHGFGIEVVRNVFQRSGDLQKTDQILLHMRRTAEAAGEAALLGSGDEQALLPEPEPAPLEEAPVSRGRHHHRPRHSGASVRTATRSPSEPAEPPFPLRHRRQHSGASATTAPRSPTSSQRKKRHQEEEEFHPQPLARDVLADTEYTPPSGSRAGAIARAEKKGRMEEGLQRERGRASGGGTLSAFAREALMQTQGQVQRRRPDMEDDVPPLPPQFAAFAEGNVEVLRELERRDLSLAMLRTADVARYMIDGTVPSPYRE
ncbi:hypothetical protein DFH06DRAFT_446447 [Mycena polygramma]|nr:hypothetical protein DFH06DRAFT_446447 [Mycena polygramma]